MKRVALAVLLCVGTLSGQAIRSNAGFLANNVPRNDDGSSPLVPIGFTVNFFGKTRSHLYVNNNGNVTFDSALATFTPFGLERTQREIIAPFFADVDTRNERSALVTFGRDTVNGRTAFGVNYINVGYFAVHADKLNSFQVVLIERSDTGEGNFDIEFNYQRITWETGDASGGRNGFGGVPAAVGWSNGTGEEGTSFELDGSLQVGAFLDGGRRSLVRNRLNSTVVGRYIFRARGGTILPPLSISTGCPLPTAQINVPYSVRLSSAGGGTNFRWALLPDPGAPLPPGINLTGDTISGTPTSSGTTEFTLRLTAATEEGDQTVAKRCSLTVAPPRLTITTGCPLPPATAGQAYNRALQISGGRPPYMWSLAEISGPLPPGISLSSSGVLSGVSSQDGTYPIVLRASSNEADGSEPVTKSCTLTVNPAVLALSSACELPNATSGVPYSQVLTVTGGSAPFTWSAASGLPAGLMLSSDGRISGIPAGPAATRFSIRVTDDRGQTITQNCSLAITESELNISTACPLPAGATGRSYSQQLGVSGGSGPYTWSVLGSLPPGLSLSSSGVLSGIPGSTGPSGFRLLVSDSAGRTGAKVCNLVVAPSDFSLTSCPLQGATVGEAYSQRLDVAGGEGPYLFTAAGGIPGGLSLSSTGLLSGSPTSAGTFPVNIRVQDRNGRTLTQPCGIVVAPSRLSISGSCPLPRGRVGSPYSSRFTVTGGSEPYTFSTSRALPAGLRLGSDGSLTGIPSAAGEVEFDIMVRDAQSRLVSRDCSIDVGQPDLPAMRIAELPSTVAAAASGPVVTFELGQSFSLPVQGQLVLKVTPDTGNPDGSIDRGDPRVRFQNGQTVANFSLAPGVRQFTMPIASTGTVAGVITVSVANLRVGNTQVISLPTPRVIRVRRQVPVMTAACIAPGAEGAASAVITGYSTTRDLRSAEFTFPHPTSGPDQKVTVDLLGTSGDYFGGDESVRNGGAFTLTIPFTVEGGTATSGSVILTNAEGSSAARPMQRCN